MKLTTFTGIAAATALWGFAASAQTTNFTFNVNEPIPDGSPFGLTFSTNLTLPSASLSNVTLTLDLKGGYNGDLYAYLEHDGYVAVLLNRVGRTSANSLGYSDAGLSITLDDSAANDVHFYQNFSPGYNGSGQVVGTWQPDGRAVPPSMVNGTEDRTNMLSGFNGQDAGGDWTLFIADLSTGGQSVLQDWSLNLGVSPVPEPEAWVLAGLGMLGMAAAGRWRQEH
ncbi:MAG TPA: PEP-CTERM sorting domain-containing protein [Candidatus Acidoferrum sp.]|nr:PEP-CTERM sorting domain-containing protein [Candidatus Acidoferrum sp.]